MGYKTYGLNIRLEDERSLYFDVALTPEEVNLGSVTVTAEKDENWKRYLQIFKDTFWASLKMHHNARFSMKMI